MRDWWVYVALGAGVFLCGWWQGHHAASAPPPPPVTVAQPPMDAGRCALGCIENEQCADAVLAVAEQRRKAGAILVECGESLKQCAGYLRACAEGREPPPTPGVKLNITGPGDCRVRSVAVTMPTPGWED